jgi:hypothetical protein
VQLAFHFLHGTTVSLWNRRGKHIKQEQYHLWDGMLLLHCTQDVKLFQPNSKTPNQDEHPWNITIQVRKARVKSLTQNFI